MVIHSFELSIEPKLWLFVAGVLVTDVWNIFLNEQKAS